MQLMLLGRDAIGQSADNSGIEEAAPEGAHDDAGRVGCRGRRRQPRP